MTIDWTIEELELPEFPGASLTVECEIDFEMDAFDPCEGPSYASGGTPPSGGGLDNFSVKVKKAETDTRIFQRPIDDLLLGQIERHLENVYFPKHFAELEERCADQAEGAMERDEDWGNER
jgi:hypothetical protein